MAVGSAGKGGEACQVIRPAAGEIVRETARGGNGGEMMGYDKEVAKVCSGDPPMRLLVTAGNTLTPIDRVRCITNVFTGRTGTGIAVHAHGRGHAVTLLTSHPEVVAELHGPTAGDRWAVRPYRTFADLEGEMEATVRAGPDVVIHCAAVSDYEAAGVYAPAPGTRFDASAARWESNDPSGPRLADRAAGKVKSHEPELWLRLVRTPKLIDRVRTDWGFRGVLVKFKLEVGMREGQLREIAERSRRQSDADLMVANTLEGAAQWALLGPLAGRYERVERADLAARLLDAVEGLHRAGRDGLGGGRPHPGAVRGPRRGRPPGPGRGDRGGHVLLRPGRP